MCSLGMDALVKEKREIRKKSTTFVLISKNTITLELSQMQLLSISIDWAHQMTVDHTSKH